MNPPSTNIQTYNNTMLGTQESISSSGDMSMPGCVFANNILGGPAAIGPGASESNDLADSPQIGFVDPAHGNFTLTRKSSAIGRGKVIAPFAQKYHGRAPDVGAYQFGMKPFTAGATTKKSRKG